MWIRAVIGLLLLSLFSIAWQICDRIPIQVIGQQTQSGGLYMAEKEFFEGLAVSADLPFKINYKPVDTIGFKDNHQLNMLKDGMLDLVSLRFSQNAEVEPALLGVDLFGGSVDIDTAYAIMKAYAPALDRRLQDRFNVKLLGMWPFGPQVFFCKKAVKSLHDLAGFRVRVTNTVFFPLMKHFGAQPVKIPFEDVKAALHSSMIDCAISSASSAYAAGWPEESTYYFPLRTQMAINGYVINLDLWHRLSSRQQVRMKKAFNVYEKSIWASVEKAHEQFSACNTGGPCSVGKSYHLIDVNPSKRDYKELYQAFKKLVIPQWAEKCDQLYPSCSREWSQLVGPIILNKSEGHH